MGLNIIFHNGKYLHWVCGKAGKINNFNNNKVYYEWEHFQGFHFKFDHGGIPSPTQLGRDFGSGGGDLTVNTINFKSTKL